MKLPRGLPKYLKDEQIEILFNNLKGHRDRAMFMVMLRCGLRVEEVAHLSLGDIDLNAECCSSKMVRVPRIVWSTSATMLFILFWIIFG